MIGHRIKLARKAAGLSLRALAERAGISHTAISKYEKDTATPPWGVLLALAEALDVGVEFFVRIGQVKLKEVEYRKHARLPKKVLDMVEGNVVEQVERFLELQVRKELGESRTRLEPRELCVLKNAYGLSMGAWLFRARDLGILSESAYLQMVNSFRSRGWHKDEPCQEYPQEKSQMFEQMAFHALAEDLITESNAAELLAVPLMDFHALRNRERADAAAYQ